MDKEIILNSWIESTKHQQGKHNQKRHGWRYSGHDQKQAQRIEDQQGASEVGVFRSRRENVWIREGVDELSPANARRAMWRTVVQKKPIKGERVYKPGAEMPVTSALVAVKKNVNDDVSFYSGIKDHQDVVLGALAKSQGFDGLPQKGSRAELDALVSDGGTELFRGIRDFGGQTAESMQKQFSDRDLFFGQGVHGNGTYVAAQHDTARGYGLITSRMVLRKEAKVVEKHELETMATAARNKFRKEIDDIQDSIMNKIFALPKDDPGIDALKQQYYALSKTQTLASRLFGDNGRFATMMGFDAIRVDRSGDDYYVLLNRTAVTVQNTLYFDKEETAGGFANVG